MNPRDIGTRNYFIGVGVFLAALFALLEPAGSTAHGLPARLVQWTAQVAIPLLLLIGAHLLLSRWRTFDGQNPWLKLGVSGVVGSLLFAPAALALDFLFDVDDARAVQSLSQLIHALAEEYAAVVLPVTVAWIGINAPRVAGLDFSGAQKTDDAPADERKSSTDQPQRSGFRALLPPEIGTDIISLMSELHYLRVVTDRGTGLVLYNLRDAVEELAAYPGLQPHRSYWVAAGHVRRLSRRSGRSFLLMSDGSEVPVSRRRLSAIRQQLADDPGVGHKS